MKWLVILLALPAMAAPKTVTLIFQGDSAGEIEACGCAGNPSGGLARRKTALTQWQHENVLLLDAGNTLYSYEGSTDGARAKVIFEVTAQLGTKAMAVGVNELAQGVDALQALAKGSSMKLLSANLRREGKPVFESGAVFEQGGVKVGVVGLTGPVSFLPGVEAADTLVAAKEALQRLGPRDVTVVLAAIPYSDAARVARELPVDIVIQSGDARGLIAPQRETESAALVLSAGQRGQAVGRAVVTLNGKRTPLADLTVVERERSQLAYLDSQLASLDERAKKAKEPDAARDFQALLKQLRERRRATADGIAKKVPAGASTFEFAWHSLGSHFVEDAEVKAALSALPR